MRVTGFSQAVTAWGLRDVAAWPQCRGLEEAAMKHPGMHGVEAGTRRFALVAALAGILSGCAALTSVFAPPPPPKPAPARPATRPAPARPVPVAPVVPARQPEPPAVPADPPIELSGVSASRLEALLGMPADRSPSGTGERWTYRGGGCALDLFLFPDVASGELSVLDRRASGGAEQDCLRRLRNAPAR